MGCEDLAHAGSDTRSNLSKSLHSAENGQPSRQEYDFGAGTLTLTLTFTLTRARVAPAGLRRDARRAHSGGGVVGAGAAVACRHRLPLRQGRGLRL